MWALVAVFSVLVSSSYPKVLNVGLLSAFNDPTLTPFIGWRQTAGAVGVAWDRVQSERILPEYDTLNLTWVFGDCVESTDAGSVIDWIEEGIDVVLGPGCSQSAIISGVVGKYFNFPMVLYAANFASSLLDVENYPTIMTSTWSSLNQARTLTRLFERYQWKEVAVLYYAVRSDVIPRCALIMDDLEVLFASENY